MSLNKSVPQLTPDSDVSVRSQAPDYVGLVRFLLQPFLESPESLSVDCELSSSKGKAWVRLAFQSDDKGRVFGRGGRNIQAVRTVLEAIAQTVGQSVHLDVYGGSGHSGNGSSSSEGDGGSSRGGGGRESSNRRPPRRSPSAPSLRPRPQ